jgi:hypothetical protein
MEGSSMTKAIPLRYQALQAHNHSIIDHKILTSAYVPTGDYLFTGPMPGPLRTLSE